MTLQGAAIYMARGYVTGADVDRRNVAACLSHGGRHYKKSNPTAAPLGPRARTSAARTERPRTGEASPVPSRPVREGRAAGGAAPGGGAAIRRTVSPLSGASPLTNI